MDEFERVNLFMDSPWNCSNEDLLISEVLAYLKRKLNEITTKEGEQDDEMELLAFYLDCAESSLVFEDPEFIAKSMFLLGLHTQKCNSFPSQVGLKLFVENAAREMPLVTKSRISRGLKELSMELAVAVWEKDVGNKMSLSDACQEVYAGLFKLLTNAIENSGDDDEALVLQKIMNGMPSRADGLKKYLREVAPSYATKPGRRKK